jgi:hypoxanthine phosphoribosyltransferase
MNRIALKISNELASSHPLVLNVPHGGLIFSGHLLTRLNFPLQLDYIHATRYSGELHGKGLRWVAKPETPLQGRVVLLLDDIFDEGNTLAALREYCVEQGAERVLAAVLLKKNHARPIASSPPEFIALEVDDRYVFGFGMDYEHEWRNANGIYALKEQDK